MVSEAALTLSNRGKVRLEFNVIDPDAADVIEPEKPCLFPPRVKLSAFNLNS